MAAIAASGLLWVSAFIGPAHSQDPGPDLTQRSSGQVNDLENAIVQGEELIRKYPDSDFTPSVMFQLVELYVKRSASNYHQKMTAYDDELKRFEAGQLRSEPTMPRTSYGEAIQMAYKILNQYPTASFNDKVVYRIALCHLEEGNRELARDYFQKLIAEYPNSEYVLECNFRIGEYHFDKKDYGQATEYYSKLLNHWENPFFDMSLYKLAWSYYNVNNYSKAISTFIYLIDDVKMVQSTKSAQVPGKTTADLRQEAIEYVAQSFAESGGPEKAREFLVQFSGKEYGIDIFLKMADIYQARNYYAESIKTLEITLQMWPLCEQGPLLQSEIVENYLQAGDHKKAEQARASLVANYGPGSEWLKKYPEGEVRDKALALAEENLYVLGTEAQTRAQESNNSEAYWQAIRRYREYTEKFPATANAPKIQYYLAECYYDIKDFASAADAYQKVLINYPNSEFKGDAAYNRILSHFEELAGSSAVDTTSYTLANFIGTGTDMTLRLPNAIYPKLLGACNDFVTIVADSARLPEVLMKFGETLFGLKEFTAAQQVYEYSITKLPSSRYVVQAHLLHAQCSMESQNYLSAEKWARKVVESYPDSSAQVQRAHRLISSAKYKLAEGFKERGDAPTAAKAFENIASASPDSTIAELALAESALQYDQAGDVVKAIEIYEKFYFKFPNSSRVDEALFRAAILCEKESKWTRAAQNYLALVTARPNSPYAGKALFASARCYESAGLPENALKTYDRYLSGPTDDIDQRIEALSRGGEICFKRKDYQLASDYYRKATATFAEARRNNHEAEPYMAAQSQFMLGEIHFETYRMINIEPPIEQSFKRKQTMLTTVLAAYKDAALFQVAEWTTAASHRIGAAYEEFGRAFWESPRPELSDELLKQYEEKLAQQIRPLKERAYEAYQANVRLAGENEISNQWVDLSRQRIQALAPELGYEVPATDPANGVHPPEPTNGIHKSEPAVGETQIGESDQPAPNVSTVSAKGNHR